MGTEVSALFAAATVAASIPPHSRGEGSDRRRDMAAADGAGAGGSIAWREDANGEYARCKSLQLVNASRPFPVYEIDAYSLINVFSQVMA